METDTIWQRTFMSKQPMADVPESEQPADDDLARSALIDPVQFAFLYRRYVTRVYRYFYGRVGNAGDAEDLTAQLFLELVTDLPRYHPQGTFTAWLFTLVRRRAVDFHRKQRPILSLELAEVVASDVDTLGTVIQTERLARLADWASIETE